MKSKALKLGTLAICSLFLTACGMSSKQAKEEEKSKSDESLTMWAAAPALPTSLKSASESPFYQGLDKHTGIKVDWQFPTDGSSAAQAFNLLLAENEYPDMIHNYFIGATDIQVGELLDDGVIQDLTELLPKKAPNYWKFLQDHPDFDKAMKTDDGRYFGFGYFREDPIQQVYKGPLVRKDWLDEQGLKVPETIQEFENVIRVFNDKYGAKFSFVPDWQLVPGMSGSFGAHGTFTMRYYIDENNKVQIGHTHKEWKDYMTWLNKLWKEQLLGCLVSNGHKVFALTNRHVAGEVGTPISALIGNNKVQIGHSHKEWKDYMTWLNKLWKEQLLDPDLLTLNADDFVKKANNDKFGITQAGAISRLMGDAVKNGSKANWVAAPYPKQADGSKPVDIFGEGGMATPMVTAISTSAKGAKLDKALKWLDWAFTEEGQTYWNYGDKGVSWEEKDGEKVYTDLIEKNDLGKGEAVRLYSGNSQNGLGVQEIRLDRLNKEFDADREAGSVWYNSNPDALKIQLPSSVTMTSEESKSVADVTSTLGTYVQENSFKFLTGERSLDEFDDFVKELDELGLPKLLAAKQAAYDRYLKR